MDDGGTIAAIAFVLLLLFDMIMCGYSVVIGQLNVKEIERRALEDKDKKSIRLLKLIQNPQGFLDVFYLTVTTIHMVIGWMYVNGFLSVVKEKVLKHAETVSCNIPLEILVILAAVFTFGLVLYIIMLIGIILPKKLALNKPERFAYAMVNFIYVWLLILRPFTGFVTATSKLILRILGMDAEKDEGDVTEEEIIHMVNEGHEQGLIEASEAEMISNIFEYHDKEAQDIMTHRNSIIALDGNMLLTEVIEFVLEGKHSRYLVYEENIDRIIGILHLKDVLRYHRDSERLNNPLHSFHDLLREPVFVPLTRNIHELFKEMQKSKLQMVVVIDEYGQTAGLVAMEDILEEIVGNIMDEYDEEERYIEKRGEDEYVIEGKTPLEELEERFSISFHEEEFETLNGFLIAKMDKIPEENEQFEIEVDGYLFKILSVEHKMIQRVLVTRLLDEKVPDNEESVLEEKNK